MVTPHFFFSKVGEGMPGCFAAATHQNALSLEADAKRGRISYNSPVGRALIGRRLGEEVEVVTPSGDRSYLIDAVDFR